MHIPLQSAKDGVDVRKALDVVIAKPKPKTIRTFRINPSRLVVKKTSDTTYQRSGTQDSDFQIRPVRPDRVIGTDWKSGHFPKTSGGAAVVRPDSCSGQ
jgi:hypothetical protein